MAAHCANQAEVAEAGAMSLADLSRKRELSEGASGPSEEAKKQQLMSFWNQFRVPSRMEMPPPPAPPIPVPVEAAPVPATIPSPVEPGVTMDPVFVGPAAVTSTVPAASAPPANPPDRVSPPNLSPPNPVPVPPADVTPAPPAPVMNPPNQVSPPNPVPVQPAAVTSAPPAPVMNTPNQVSPPNPVPVQPAAVTSAASPAPVMNPPNQVSPPNPVPVQPAPVTSAASPAPVMSPPNQVSPPNPVPVQPADVSPAPPAPVMSPPNPVPVQPADVTPAPPAPVMNTPNQVSPPNPVPVQPAAVTSAASPAPVMNPPNQVSPPNPVPVQPAAVTSAASPAPVMNPPNQVSPPNPVPAQPAPVPAQPVPLTSAPPAPLTSLPNPVPAGSKVVFPSELWDENVFKMVEAKLSDLEIAEFNRLLSEAKHHPEMDSYVAGFRAEYGFDEKEWSFGDDHPHEDLMAFHTWCIVRQNMKEKQDGVEGAVAPAPPNRVSGEQAPAPAPVMMPPAPTPVMIPPNPVPVEQAAATLTAPAPVMMSVPPALVQPAVTSTAPAPVMMPPPQALVQPAGMTSTSSPPLMMSSVPVPSQAAAASVPAVSATAPATVMVSPAPAPVTSPMRPTIVPTPHTTFFGPDGLPVAGPRPPAHMSPTPNPSTMTPATPSHGASARVHDTLNLAKALKLSLEPPAPKAPRPEAPASAPVAALPQSAPAGPTAPSSEQHVLDANARVASALLNASATMTRPDPAPSLYTSGSDDAMMKALHAIAQKGLDSTNPRAAERALKIIQAAIGGAPAAEPSPALPAHGQQPKVPAPHPPPAPVNSNTGPAALPATLQVPTSAPQTPSTPAPASVNNNTLPPSTPGIPTPVPPVQAFPAPASVNSNTCPAVLPGTPTAAPSTPAAAPCLEIVPVNRCTSERATSVTHARDWAAFRRFCERNPKCNELVSAWSSRPQPTNNMYCVQLNVQFVLQFVLDVFQYCFVAFNLFLPFLRGSSDQRLNMFQKWMIADGQQRCFLWYVHVDASTIYVYMYICIYMLYICMYNILYMYIYMHAGVQTFDFHKRRVDSECFTGDGFALEAAIRFRRVQEEQALDKGILAGWTSETKNAHYKRHALCRS